MERDQCRSLVRAQSRRSSDPDDFFRDGSSRQTRCRAVTLLLRSVFRDPLGADGAEFISGTLCVNDHYHDDSGDEHQRGSYPEHFDISGNVTKP